jgi:hypothetical protein
MSQLVQRSLHELFGFNNCLVCLLSELHQIRCMVVMCACDPWFSLVMSISWLANVEHSAADKQINFQLFSYCGTWCNLSPVSVPSNSWQIDSHSRLFALFPDVLSGAIFGLWFWHPLWKSDNLRPCLVVVSDMGFSSGTNAAVEGTAAIVNTLISCYPSLLLWSVVMPGVCVLFAPWFRYHLVKLSLEELLLFSLHHGLLNGYNK